MGIRDWLAIIVIVFIVLILLDGFRRKWLERRSRIVMKLDKSLSAREMTDEDGDPLTQSELPNGGARSIPRSGDSPVLQKGEQVPVLIESVDLDNEDIEEYPPADDDLDKIEDMEYEEDLEDEDVPEDEKDHELMDDEYAGDDSDDEGRWDDDDDFAEEEDAEEDTDVEKKGFLGRKRTSERIEPTFGGDEPTFGDEELTFGRDDQGELDLEHHDLFEHDASDDTEEDDDEQELAEEVLIINVMAKPEGTIEGKRLLPVLLKHGMRLGEMSIFHRHADTDGKGPVMFSMANMLKPGTFSLSEMEEFYTPGVCFFMQLPNKLGNMECFNQMLNTAEAVKEEMDAILKDENRSVFTRQTIEHSRQRIRDFELEMLARK